MPDVVCNTTPLQYLHQIGCLHLLSDLYQTLIVPQAVVDELRQGELRGVDVPSLGALPWVKVQRVSSVDLGQVPAGLDAGEREVLALALGKADPLLILDDAAARNQARALGIRFTGTVGVLMKAQETGLIPAIRPWLDRLDQAGFYLRPEVRARVLELMGESP
jgi:uncharacterized protein